MSDEPIPPDAGFEGFAPELAIGTGNPEAEKYGRMWAHPEYRKVAPGEQLAQAFLAQARPKTGASVIDFGCGTGRGGLMLAVLGQMNVTLVDFVRNSLDDDIRAMLDAQAHALRFVKADLERPLPVAAEYGFACDVLEHIPPDKVNDVLNNILLAAQHVFFSISTVDDSCGQLIGEALHLTVRPYAWWLAQFNARDCVVHWSQEIAGAALFYVTAWQTGQAIVDSGVLNTSEEQVKANVRANTAQGWAQVQPHETNDVEVMILGGGPSIAAFEDDIREKKAAGVKLVTLNGAYKWALDRGLGPVTQIMVDARPFNARFVQPIDPACLYLIASQCDPSVLQVWRLRIAAADPGVFVKSIRGGDLVLGDGDRPFEFRTEAAALVAAERLRAAGYEQYEVVRDGLPKDRTLLWHTSTELIRDILNAAYPKGWWTIPGGSTVLLRAIPLLRLLGFKRFHLYGCDSCLGDEERHHAYSQPENDGAFVMNVTVGGRVFACHPWMASQATEFLDLVKFLGDEIELEVYGDGLLSWTLEHAAQLQADEESTWPTA